MIELISNSEISRLLRHSLWIYPLVNAGHIIGLGLLIGAIGPLDLRLLGFWRSVPVNLLARVLIPVAMFGFVLAVVCGILLFISRPGDYVESVLFISKLSLVVAAVLNSAWLVMTPDWRVAQQSGALSTQVKLHSVFSIVIWISVIICGRLIGYR